MTLTLHEILPKNQIAMSNSQNHSTNSWQITQTADGSPSLLLGRDCELMHNSAGAFSETCHVYGPAIRETLASLFFPYSFFSLGLGLGYVEMLIAAEAASKDIKPDSVFIETWESNDELRLNFVTWLNTGSSHLPLTEISEIFESHFFLPKNTVVQYLNQLFASGHWKLNLEFNKNQKMIHTYQCICYDAFSSKTCPELWDDDLLNKLLDQTETRFATFATYAASTRLKKLLKQNGFMVQKRVGFAKKRECLWAIKNKKAAIPKDSGL